MADHLTGAQREKIVQKALAQLMEHFDTVQIFATRWDPQDCTTGSINRGNGNFYARIGQVREWVEREDEAARVEVRAYEGED